MNKIHKVKIEGFWTDKTVNLIFKDDVNFLIGVNGSGKTTVINLIAATLNADFSTLDRIQFKKIRIDLEDIASESKQSKTAFIEVEKTNKAASPYPNIIFRIKKYTDKTPKSYNLDNLEEEHLFRYPSEYIIHRKSNRNVPFEKDINSYLSEIINVTWLSINRTNQNLRRREERGFESTIDQKIEELQNELIKYFSKLNRNYSFETDSFQKFFFESLLDSTTNLDVDLNIEDEKKSLREISDHFKLDKSIINEKIEAHFAGYQRSIKKIIEKEDIYLKDMGFITQMNRIHLVVKEWTLLNQKQTKINEPKDTFLKLINNLLQNKELVINDKNEILVKTNKNNYFPPIHLSSGEKQLLIILGQSLLQESNTHIYIADEPELSLHVEWQEKLVSNLKKLNPNSQIIFATHSPDIVGEFSSSVIKIEDSIS